MRSCDIYIAITTYDRPEEFQALMDDIVRESQGKNVHIHVYDDNSPVDYHGDYVYNLTKYSYNHGKQRYWQVMNDVLRDAETWNFKYFFFLQDDCRLVENFFELAIDEFNSIQDQNKATLCTFTPHSIYERTMWGKKKAQDVTFNNRKFIQCNYVDCIFMCPRETLKLLNFKIDPVPLTRFVNKIISSGVGQQITTRLMRIRKTMYCSWSSLINSHSNLSKMNKEERMKNPLTPLIRDQEEPIKLSDMLSLKKERVTVGIASIKNRENSLEKTVLSLINQVDELHIYLNDYEKVPMFLQNNDKIKFYLGKIYRDKGDTGKFYGLKDINDGYYFSCDDDLIYPEDYVQKTISLLQANNNKIIVSYHGVILKTGKLDNYYRNRKQIHYSCFQREPVQVHIGGTGVMAFYIPNFKPDISQFKYPNMADIWVGIQAQQNYIPIICGPRPLHWIKAEEIPMSETIYGSKKNHDVQTQVLNEYKQLHGEFLMV